MGHTSRLATRKSATPSEWLKVCSQIGEQANAWANRGDLVVYGGEDAGMGQALACFITDTAEIEISLPVAFGKATTPEMVGDLTLRKNQYEFPEAVGVILHEAFHARYSGWNYDLLESQDPQVGEAFMLLEESRIEGKAVYHYPENALFLRASAMGLSFAEAEESMEGKTKTGAFAHLSALTLARVDAGVLDDFDVATLETMIFDNLGEETLGKLRAIWQEFQTLNVGQIARGIELAEAWVQAVRERAIEQGENPDEPEGGCELGSELSDEMKKVLGEIMDALGEAMGDVATDNADALADQEQDEKRKEEAKERASASKQKAEREAEAEKVFSPTSGNPTGSGSSSRLHQTRKPQGVERAGAVKLAQMLDKAKYVERSLTQIDSVIPQGRLRPRALVQKKALEAKGVRSDLPTWRATKRKHTDDPELSIGVMVDISGSMGSAMESMASIAWILSEAGRRVQARTAMVYFGSGVFSTLKVGQHLEEVKVFTAPDGTEEFGKAYKALDGTMGLTTRSGVRLLVIVSDGHFRGDQETAMDKAIAECERTGVGVLWITPAECYGGIENRLAKTHAQHLKATDTTTIATAIGKSATEALAKIGGRV